MTTWLKAACLSIVCIALALGVAACGGSGSSSTTESAKTAEATTASADQPANGKEVEIDVGTTVLKYPAGTKPKIAMFASSGTNIEETLHHTAEETADKYGYDFTYYDSKYDATTQLQQLQNALSGGDYNAWILEADAGKLACSTVKKASEQGIAVVQVQDYTCEQAGKPAGEESWTPGTVSSVGGATTLTYYEAFAKKVAETIKSPEAEVGVITGTPTAPTTEELQEGLEKAGLNVVDESNTSYSTPEALSATQTMLQAHPDLGALVAISDDPTLGAVRAIEGSGKSGDLEVFGFGGSSETVKLIEEGKVALVAPYYPASTAQQGVEAIHKAFEGEPVERFYNGFPSGSADEPFFVTKATVSKYEPQF